MTDSNLLFDSFSVSANPSIGGSGTLFVGSISAERTSNSIISSINSNISSSSVSGGVNVIPVTNSTSYGSGGSTTTAISNGIKTPPSGTSNSSGTTSLSNSSSSNNNKPSQNDNSLGNTNSNNDGSSASSPQNAEHENNSPTDLWRSTTSGAIASLHGLDLSKPPTLSLSEAEIIKKEIQCDDNNGDTSAGLDLSKPEMPSPNESYRPPSFTNGAHSDPPTPQGGSHAPSRSISTGSGADNGDEAECSGSSFGTESIVNDRGSDALTNGDTPAPLSLSSSLLGIPLDRSGYMKSSPKFPDPYSTKMFDGMSPPPLKYGLTNFPPLFDHQVPKSAASEPHQKSPGSLPSSKYKDSYIAARLAADNTFVKPLDTSSYSKLLEGYGHNARNNNNNNNNTSNNNNTGSKSELHESYAKHIENLANGYKAESSPLSKDAMLFKGDASLPPSSSSSSSLGSFPKREGSLTNGTSSSFGVVAKSDPSTSSSAHSPGSNSSLPSILNFSTNHLRGMATGEGGLASYLSSYSMGGPLPGSRSGAAGVGETRPPGGGSTAADGGVARASPQQNKLACRFCGKTFSQAGYIKAHERLHTGEKPFACSVCGKRFSDPSNWKKHERVHANNKKAAGSGGHVTGLDHSDSKHGVALLRATITVLNNAGLRGSSSPSEETAAVSTITVEIGLALPPQSLW
ncbi:zinc finger protein 787 [Elysia marginata]|uniref:Zinc finger protein 787 n=1 Tax=Elysia marginata TaxID=1093978 RepID=A0AAV4IGV9_9GAST|nr:zinc finger protein 787 [Elysia marginata]